MDATTSALVQITHIQFLALLYPSRLEQRLVLFLLGPLALLSASMELLPIHQNQKTVDVADTICNTCNAALSLLFTAALFLWGFAINRKQAWRTDGGTAVFGGAALALAIISTALNFLYIPTKDQYLWLPSLIWAAVLWQSFLGWWWWEGGGRGVGEVGSSCKAHPGSVPIEEGEAIEMTDHSRGPNITQAVEASSTSTSASSPTTTEAGPSNILAHLAAALSQALERMRLRRTVYGNEVAAAARTSGTLPEAADTDVVGWGLGSFGLRERERRENEMAELQDREDLALHTQTHNEDDLDREEAGRERRPLRGGQR
ncbi:uncharacterized protein FOMMEDRAFT_161267 [Fomitiporia mediterranea MF3/22]|uniref:uncharacterized protein n=1 Tax=Fomitiporia mediterranea (strain MF3/22) TaxID=694068 RepID=UPI0004408709|nr:uncharacterized protein FOMMEDRAFT_161267 [Fomitiporia mediterranea MF3/22]EJC99047.1 hypothetical protein FOMMEDRAFT_161267 [Fomitiporia mediterranea MF3/22]